jgi:hypothetical protein
MNIKSLIFGAVALLVGLAAFNVGSNAQGPLWDKVIVNLPYSVTVGDRVLEPGEYSIKQLSSPGGANRVLLVYKDDMEFETSAMTIPTLDQNTPEDTKVVLHHIGSDYYFDKIWIQGKNYGYEFILPDAVKARQRERMEPISVAARYESIPQETAQQTTTTTTTEQQTTTVEPPRQEETQIAQAPPPPPVEREEPAPAPVTPPPSAEREEPVRTMPETSANWLFMLLGGSLLSGAAMALRRQ